MSEENIIEITGDNTEEFEIGEDTAGNIGKDITETTDGTYVVYGP